MKKTIAVLMSVLMMLSVLPAASVDTQADWNMASQIVQAIERPQIPTDYSVNIKDMGAKGDGVSNDLPVLQQAIDETSERGGGRVIVPEGTYYLAGPVNLKSYVDLHLEGDADGQFHVGLMLSRGEGVARNMEMACSWLRKAALQGHDQARISLGILYAEGEGAPEGREEVMDWLRETAGKGSAEARKILEKLEEDATAD